MPNELLDQPVQPRPSPEGSVEASIDARTVVDEQGYERRIYDITPGLSISFRGREELPTISQADLSGGSSEVLLTADEAPRQIVPQEYQSYVDTHANMAANNQHLIVNATPVGVLDLAIRLRGEQTPDPALQTLRSHLHEGTIGDPENALLDMMSAAEFTGQPPETAVERTDGLLDVALALGGDKAKQAKLAEKMKILESQEEHLVTRELGEDAVGLVFEHEPIEPEVIKQAEGLVLVRTTDNKPGVTEDGTVYMLAASEYTKNMSGSTTNSAYVPRHTTHFSLNHHVQSHIFGNFGNRGYTVVAPLSGALEANGRPGSLIGVDTYFDAGPGEKVKLPEAIIIEPATEDQTEIVVNEANIRRFKSGGFKAEDIDRVVEACSEGGTFAGLYPGGFEPSMARGLVVEAGRNTALITEDGTTEYFDESDEKIHHRQVVSAASIEGMNATEILNLVSAIDSHALDSLMKDVVEGLAVKSTIIEQGGNVVKPAFTSNFIETPGFDERVGTLAKVLHVKSALHMNTIEHDIEQLSTGKLHQSRVYRDNRFEWENPNEAIGEELNELLSRADCPQRLRRAALEEGLLTVRGETARIRSDNKDMPIIP